MNTSYIPPIVRLESPVKLRLTQRQLPPRVVTPGATPASPAPSIEREFAVFPMTLRSDPMAQTITAHLSPLPRGLQIYGPEDYSAAAGDSMDDHVARVLQILGSDPARVLQALIDGGEMPPRPPRVPREIPNWRCKAVLHQMGLLATVEAGMEAMTDPERTVALFAWNGDGKVARKGPTVIGLAAALGLTDAQVDEMFIAADGIEV
jgi:hypothetical protein